MPTSKILKSNIYFSTFLPPSKKFVFLIATKLYVIGDGRVLFLRIISEDHNPSIFSISTALVCLFSTFQNVLPYNSIHSYAIV
jgi:hypothetical protein